MSRPEPSDEDEIFEKLRRREINLRQAYKLLQEGEAKRGAVEPLPGTPGATGLRARLKAAFARLRRRRPAPHDRGPA